MPMTNDETQLRGPGDPRLAIHAAGSSPAWLWSIDGTRILWANPVGAKLFGASNAAALSAVIWGPADPQRRQLAQLVGRLPSNGSTRLERLRGFGARLGALVTCACARLEFPDGVPGILVVAVEPVGRGMPLLDRLRGLVDGVEAPIAVFTRDGLFVGANDAAQALVGFRNLFDGDFDQSRHDALKQGRAEIPIGEGDLVLQRVGAGADVGLVALLASREPLSTAGRANLETEAPESVTVEPIEAPDACSAFDPVQTEPEPNVLEQPLHSIADIVDTLAPPAPDDFGIVAEPETLPAPMTETDAAEPPVHVEGRSMTEEAATVNAIDEPPPPRTYPLRFVWQIDAEQNFSQTSADFARLLGPHTAAMLGLRWNDIADVLMLDPERRVAKAIATRDTWSGITLQWPVDGGEFLEVEMAGLPVRDRDQKFAGYRGFGVCRDLAALTRIDALRSQQPTTPAPLPRPLSAATPSFARPSVATPTFDTPSFDTPPADQPAAPVVQEWPSIPDVQPDMEAPKEAAEPLDASLNVVLFRQSGEQQLPELTPVENSAFNELARRLSARLESEIGGDVIRREPGARPDTVIETPAADWLVAPALPAQGDSRRDRALLDLLPVGVLIYRLDRLLYANDVFLKRMGYDTLYALEDDGGLDALFVESCDFPASSVSEGGTPITITATRASPEQTQQPPTPARLFTIKWDGDSALALIFSAAPGHPSPAPMAAAATVTEPSAVGHANAEELGAILDTTAEGIVMFDAEGALNSCNRSAEALFGYDSNDLVQRNLTGLFAPESQRVVRDYLESIKGSGVASLLDHGREVLGQVRAGGIVPLSMTMGRTRPDGPNFFAVFRDLSQVKKTEADLSQARRSAERAAGAKADVLARISHEVRAPLNAILGFADVMIEQRFGVLGNDRYVEYMKDIRASGEKVFAIVNDLLELSRIEAGLLDLSFASQNLNELVEQCVTLLQPQANRERIIIRTSLAHLLPPVIADAAALRQITMNLIGNSIHLANAGGQVIVSTALSDFGDVVLRVRDTGHGLNDTEVAAAMEPFRTAAPSDQSDGAGVTLSLTKALVEANRAQVQIKSAAHGTLIEVTFSPSMAKA
jgi:PAS domain S-box-containing protein